MVQPEVRLDHSGCSVRQERMWGCWWEAVAVESAQVHHPLMILAQTWVVEGKGQTDLRII